MSTPPGPRPGSPNVWLAMGPILGGLTGAVGGLLAGIGFWISYAEWLWAPVLFFFGGIFGLAFGLAVGAVLTQVDRDGVPLRRRMITGGAVTFVLAMLLAQVFVPLLFSTGGLRSPYDPTMAGFLFLATGPAAVLAGLAVAWVIRRDLRGTQRG